MSRFNFKNTGVIWTGILSAILQYFVDSGSGTSSGTKTVVGAVLTLLVALHGALTGSVLSGNQTAKRLDTLVSEGESVITNAQGEK